MFFYTADKIYLLCRLMYIILSATSALPVISHPPQTCACIIRDVLFMKFNGAFLLRYKNLLDFFFLRSYCQMKHNTPTDFLHREDNLAYHEKQKKKKIRQSQSSAVRGSAGAVRKRTPANKCFPRSVCCTPSAHSTGERQEWNSYVQEGEL